MRCSRSTEVPEQSRERRVCILIFILTGSLRSQTLASFADSRFVRRLSLRSPTIALFADSFTRATNDESLVAD